MFRLVHGYCDTGWKACEAELVLTMNSESEGVNPKEFYSGQ